MENQFNSMTFSYHRKAKSYTNWWKFLYLQLLFKLSLHYLTHPFHFQWLFHDFWHISSFPWLLQAWKYFFKFHDFSRFSMTARTLLQRVKFTRWLSYLLKMALTGCPKVHAFIFIVSMGRSHFLTIKAYFKISDNCDAASCAHFTIYIVVRLCITICPFTYPLLKILLYSCLYNMLGPPCLSDC